MADIKPKIWNSTATGQLARVLAEIDNVPAMQSFLRDVMTESEIVEISARLEAARLLTSGAKYADIQATTKLSSRTIARISDWMQNGTGGYASALAISQHHAQTTRPGEA